MGQARSIGEIKCFIQTQFSFMVFYVGEHEQVYMLERWRYPDDQFAVPIEFKTQ